MVAVFFSEQLQGDDIFIINSIEVEVPNTHILSHFRCCRAHQRRDKQQQGGVGGQEVK